MLSKTPARAPSARQEGFVHGALLLALALVGVVLYALTKSEIETPVDPQAYRTLATADAITARMESAYAQYVAQSALGHQAPYDAMGQRMVAGYQLDSSEKATGVVFVNLLESEDLCKAINSVLGRTTDLSISYESVRSLASSLKGDGCGLVGQSIIYARIFAPT